MSFRVIDNPDFKKFKAHAGFKNHEFKLLAGLFSRAAADKVLFDISVNVDFDEGICSFAYYKSAHAPAYLELIIRQVGPRTSMYELYKEGKGRIAKSGLFQRVYERLEREVEELL